MLALQPARLSPGFCAASSMYAHKISPYQPQICCYLSLSSHSYLLIPPFSSVPTPQRHQSLTHTHTHTPNLLRLVAFPIVCQTTGAALLLLLPTSSTRCGQRETGLTGEIWRKKKRKRQINVDERNWRDLGGGTAGCLALYWYPWASVTFYHRLFGSVSSAKAPSDWLHGRGGDELMSRRSKTDKQSPPTAVVHQRHRC